MENETPGLEPLRQACPGGLVPASYARGRLCPDPLVCLSQCTPSARPYLRTAGVDAECSLQTAAVEFPVERTACHMVAREGPESKTKLP